MMLDKIRQLLAKKKYYRKAYGLNQLGDNPARLLLILFAVAIIVKLPFAFLPFPYSWDAVDYMNSSVNLARSGFYSIDGVTPNVSRSFSYPAMLACMHLLFGVSMKAPIILNLILSSLASVLIFLLCLKKFNRKVAFAAYALMLLVPGINLNIPQILSENAAIFLLALFLFLFFYFERDSLMLSLSCGAVLLLLVYSRSAFVLAMPALLIMLVLSKSKTLRKRAAITLAVAFILMNAWALRNQYWTGNYSYFGTEGGISVYVGFRTEFDGVWTGMPTRLENGVLWARDKTLLRIVQAYPKEEWNRQFMNETLNEIRSKPMVVAALSLKNLGRTWFPPFAYNFLVKDYLNSTGYDFSSMRLWTTFAANIYFLAWIALLLFALAGIRISRYGELEVFAISFLVISTLAFSALEPIPRYHVSLLPALFIFAAIGIFFAYEKYARKYFL